MAASDLISFLALSLYAAVGIKLLRSYRRQEPEEEEPEEEPTAFEYLTVREQIAAAKTLSDKIGEMEQLQTDLVESTPDDLLCVHLEWIGRDGAAHAYDLMCSGSDTASDGLTAAAERESYMLRGTLSRQCATLSAATQRTQNGTQNEWECKGEWCDGEAVHNVRGSDTVG
ncbi:MAG: hypothetical protein J6V15_03050 [Clostridia bacterium]|nr:hypothetical protein [Clostridia bacterium]